MYFKLKKTLLNFAFNLYNLNFEVLDVFRYYIKINQLTSSIL
jgi:hypothetical protein